MPDSQLTMRDELPLAGRSMELRGFTRAQPDDQAGALARAKLVFSTGAAVDRYDWARDRPYREQLVVEAGAIRLGRLQRGAPLLNTHAAWSLESQLGVVENPTIRGGVGECDVTFSRRESVAGYVQDVQDGVIRNVSTGYVRHRIEMVPPPGEGDPWVYRVVDWEPVEVSLVPVPADMDAQVQARSGNTADAPAAARHLRTFPCEFIELPRDGAASPSTSNRGNTMQQAAGAGAAQNTNPNADDVRALVLRHGLPSEFGDGLVREGLSLEHVNRRVLDELARRDQAAGGHVNVNPSQRAYGPRTYMGQGGNMDREQMREQMAGALASRIGGPQLTQENPYVGMRVADMARECLELTGVRTTGMTPNDLIERGLHATSDFPNLLTGTGERVLRQAYMSYQGGIKRICRASTARDFRAKARLALGEAPALLKVNENGEFTSGTMAEAKESYSLATYGRIFGITRQALVNDDLDAFGEMNIKFGRAAAEFEAQFVVTLLISNPTMGDSVALFHASHSNLGTGAGSALQLSSLTTARTAMRLMKGLDKATPIDATPAYLVVPAALETTGQQLITQITPALVSSVNPFAGKLELVVDPRLDVNSATAWYLAADPATIDTIENAYLESEAGPQLFVDPGFDVDGVRVKVRLDFGAGVLDFRGLYKANGA